MPNSDIEVYRKVRGEYLGGGGTSLAVRTLVGAVDELARAYGDAFDLSSVCHFLDTIITEAGELKKDLQKASAQVL